MRIVLLILAFIGAFMSSKFISYFIPVHADGTYNLYVRGGFVPEQNFAQVVWIIIVSLLLYRLFTYLYTQKPRAFKVLFVLFIVFSVWATSVLPLIGSYVGNLDSFHNGEALAPARDFSAGKPLYSGMFVLHGTGDDVFIPSLALHAANVFDKGGGISYYYLFTSLLQLVSAALFVYLLSKLFKRTSLWIATSIWFTLSVYSQFSYVRDIFTWTSILLAYYLLTKATGRARMIGLVGLGLLSSVTLFYAVDRGILITLLTALVTLVLVFAETTRKGILRFRVSRERRDYVPLALVIGSAVVVQLVGIILLGLTRYKDFIVTSFIQIPKYDGLLFNYPMPNLSVESLPTWLPVFLAPVAIIMLYRLYRLERKFTAAPEIAFSAILLLVGIIFLRTGYGRPDWGHIAYSTPVLFVAIFYVSVLYAKRFLNAPNHMWLVGLVIVSLFIPVSSIDKAKVSSLTSMETKQVTRFIKLPVTKDSTWTPPALQAVTDYIDKNTKSSDPIFVFNQQPIYYYLAKRHNPTRFYVTWFADPTPLENEMLQSLKKEPPKYIVYSGSVNWDTPDGVTMAQRTPKVNAWILAHYPTKTTIDGVLILSGSTK